MGTSSPKARSRPWAADTPHRAHRRAEAGARDKQTPAQGCRVWGARVEPDLGVLMGAASLRKSSRIFRTPQPWAQRPATLLVWLSHLPTGAAWFQSRSRFPGDLLSPWPAQRCARGAPRRPRTPSLLAGHQGRLDDQTARKGKAQAGPPLCPVTTLMPHAEGKPQPRPLQ